MKRLVLTGFAIVMALYVGFGALLYLNQRSILYFPREPVAHGFEELKLASDGLRINVIVVNPGADRAVVYFGGNGESVASTAAKYAALPDYTFYFLEYRGYGLSEGKPSEAGIYSDALLLMDQLANQYAGVAVVGRSLGSGVATYVAANRNVSAMVLVTPFDSITRVAQQRFRFYPAALIVQDTYDSYSRVVDITTPSLVLAAERDRVVPGPHTIALFSRMNRATTEMVTLVGTGHNTIGSHPDYLPLIAQHLTQALTD